MKLKITFAVLASLFFLGSLLNFVMLWTGSTYPPLFVIAVLQFGLGVVFAGAAIARRVKKLSVCPECGAQNKPGYRFCGSCGAKVS